ncbi:unnamed protein product, partial [Symbiodinium pilosum]
DLDNCRELSGERFEEVMKAWEDRLVFFKKLTSELKLMHEHASRSMWTDTSSCTGSQRVHADGLARCVRDFLRQEEVERKKRLQTALDMPSSGDEQMSSPNLAADAADVEVEPGWPEVLKNATEMHELVRDLELKQNLHNKIEDVDDPLQQWELEEADPMSFFPVMPEDEEAWEEMDEPILHMPVVESQQSPARCKPGLVRQAVVAASGAAKLVSWWRLLPRRTHQPKAYRGYSSDVLST